MICLCEFNAKNIKGAKKSTIKLEKDGPYYYWLTYYGDRSTKYINIEDAKRDAIELYGNWNGFKLLI